MAKKASDKTRKEATLTQSLKRLACFVWPRLGGWQKNRAVAAASFLALAKVASLAIPWILGQLVSVAAERTGELFAVLGGLVAAYAAVRFLQVAFTELKDLLFVRVVQDLIRTMSRELFAHLHSLSLQFHLSRQTGGLSLAMERGTKGIEFMLNFVLFRIIPTFAELFAVCLIFWGLYGLRYGLVIAATIVLYIGFTVWYSSKRVVHRRQLNDANEASSTKAVDSLLNHETVKMFSAERREVEKYDRALAHYEGRAVFVQGSLSILNAVQALIITAGLAAILLFAAADADRGAVDAGDIATLNAYLLQMFLPLGFLGTFYRMARDSLVNMERAFDMLDTVSTVQDAEGAQPLPVGPGAVEFRDVSLTLGERKVIDGISFQIPALERHAIVGTTGSGKTTVTRLLSRLIDPDEGEVLIDGHDVSGVTQLSVRAAIAFVPQDIVLFNDTLGMNIKFSDPGASDEKVAAALGDAGMAPFVANLPDGLGTQVGERGLKVSGGERQRIAIARALLKDPRIMVLDEATSALDSQTERQVKEAMERASKGRTTLVIAHRLATVTDCDRIMVLEGGRIVEAGTHDELVERNGAYARSWRMQSVAENGDEAEDAQPAPAT